MWDKSNCSVICTLFKTTFLCKWDERGERPFLWPLASFPDRHTYSVILFSTVSPPAGTSSGPVVLRFAVRRMARATSNEVVEALAPSRPILVQFLSLFFVMLQVFTIPFPSVCDLCSFSQIFASCGLDALQTWLELSSHWFDYLEELSEISFLVRCFLFYARAFQLLLFIYSELFLYLSLQFLISVLIFAFCFPLIPDFCESLIIVLFLFLLRLDASNRFCGYFQQVCIGTFSEIFWDYLILCSLQCHKPVGHLCRKLYCFLFLVLRRNRKRQIQK